MSDTAHTTVEIVSRDTSKHRYKFPYKFKDDVSSREWRFCQLEYTFISQVHPHLLSQKTVILLKLLSIPIYSNLVASFQLTACQHKDRDLVLKIGHSPGELQKFFKNVMEHSLIPSLGA